MNARRFFAAFLALALAAGGAASPSAAQPTAREGPLTVAPAHPQAGERVAVAYDPQAEGARLRSPGALELVVRTQRPDYRVLPMEKDGGRWTAHFVPDSSARFLRFYVQSDSAKDPRGVSEGAGWGRMIYGKDGRPVRGAHVARASFLREKCVAAPRCDTLAAQAYRRERALYPDHLVARAHLRAWRAARADSKARADSLRRAMLDELDAVRRRHADDPEKLREVQRAYYALGRRGRAQSVGATLMERAPSGPEAILAAFRRATAEGQRPARARRRAEDFLKRFPGTFFESGIYEALFKKYRAAGMVDSMQWAGRRWIRAEEVNPARARGRLARALAEAERYDAAKAQARRAVRAVTEETPTEYSFFKTQGGWDWAPAPRTPAERRAQARRQRGRHRAVLGRLFFRKKNYAKAAEVLAQAADENPGDPSVWGDLAKAREQAGRLDRAFAAAQEVLRRAPTRRAGRALFRRLYARRHGSEEGLHAAVARLARGTLLEERLDRAAPALRLTRLDSSAPGEETAGHATRGDSLRGGALAGKVLVLDFWASWCGPCHEAFPHLQTAYEQYRDAPDVRFLVVNTSWNETKARARRFIEKAGYTFPLYWDAGGRLARAFGIRGIPATVLIGKGGRVQYRESGFGGPEQYVDNLTMRIDLLRSLPAGGADPAGEGAKRATGR